MIRHLLTGILSAARLAAVGIAGAAADDVYQRLSPSAVDVLAQVVVLAGLITALVVALAGMRAAPRGRRSR